MVIADTITGFNLMIAITTGARLEAGYGSHGNVGNVSDSLTMYNGGYNGGSAGSYSCGGSSGWAFIYCNNVVNQDTTATILEN